MNHSSTTSFIAPWWIRNAHIQTLWLTFFRPTPKVNTYEERLELPDGDFLDLAFTSSENNGPLVLLLHGITGSLQSNYIAGMLLCLAKNGYQGVLMHYRNCSDTPNRLPRLYHSGETKDPLFVIQHLRERFPNRDLAIVGYSMGGNILLKLLAENPNIEHLKTAIAVSVPFMLNHCADKLNTGFAKVYQYNLIRGMIKKIIAKNRITPLNGIDIDTVKRCKNFWEFDDRVTAKLHGFKNVHDYYTRSSCRQYLKAIRTPTLILHAKDDPFLKNIAIPKSLELSDTTTLEISEHGGHLGFINGKWPWQANYWLENRITSHLKNIFSA